MKVAMLTMGLLAATAARADESKVEVGDLPKPVLAAVKARFPEAKVTKAEKEDEGGKVVYEVAIEDDGRKGELAITPKGKVLEVETEVAPKKLPASVRKALKKKYPEAKIKKAEEVVKYEGDADDEEERVIEVVLSRDGGDDVEVKFAPKWKLVDDEDDGDDKKGQKAKKKDGKKKKEMGDKEDKG